MGGRGWLLALEGCEIWDSRIDSSANGQPETDTTAAMPLPRTFEDLIQTVDIIPGQSLMPQETSRLESSYIRLDSEELQPHRDIASLLPNAVANWSQTEKAKPVEAVCYDPSL